MAFSEAYREYGIFGALGLSDHESDMAWMCAGEGGFRWGSYEVRNEHRGQGDLSKAEGSQSMVGDETRGAVRVPVRRKPVGTYRPVLTERGWL